MYSTQASLTTLRSLFVTMNDSSLDCPSVVQSPLQAPTVVGVGSTWPPACLPCCLPQLKFLFACVFPQSMYCDSRLYLQSRQF